MMLPPQGPGARCGFGVGQIGRQLLLFGGVSDEDQGDHLVSTFYNDVRASRPSSSMHAAIARPGSPQLRREETTYLSPTDHSHGDSNMSSKFPDRNRAAVEPPSRGSPDLPDGRWLCVWD
jgi:hypothetical protein